MKSRPLLLARSLSGTADTSSRLAAIHFDVRSAARLHVSQTWVGLQ